MADDDEQEFASYLADLLEHHAAGDVSDIPVEVQGTRVDIKHNRQPGNLIDILQQILPSRQNLADVGKGFLGPAKTPQEAGQRMESIGAVAPWMPGVPTALGKGVGAGTNLIKKALSNPQNIQRILGAVSALAGATTPALGQKAPAQKTAPATPPPAEVTKSQYEAAKDLIRDEMKAARERIQKIHDSPQMMSGGQRVWDKKTQTSTTTKPTFNQAAFEQQTADDRKLLVDKQQALDDMEYNEKTFTERNQWFLPASALVALGLGHGLSNMMTKDIVRETGRIPQGLDKWLQVAETGGLGVADAFATTFLPYQKDLKGVGRAKEEAEKKTFGDLMKELGTEGAIDFTMAAIGGKTGMMQGGRDKNIFASPAYKARTGATNIIPQIQQAEDLRRTFAPKALPAPAAAAPPVAALPAATPLKPPRPRYSKIKGWFDSNAPGNPKIRGWEKVPPPPEEAEEVEEATAANPLAPTKKTVPGQAVMPNVTGNEGVRSLLRNLGTKPAGPTEGFMGEPEK